MGKYLLFLLTAIILSACVAAPLEPSDPLTAKLEAEAHIQATALRATQEAAVATVTAAVRMERAQAEIDQEMARLAIRQTEAAIVQGQATATAGAYALAASMSTSTAEAWAGEATRAAIYQASLTRAEEEQFAREMSLFWRKFVPITVAAFAFLALAMAALFAWRWLEWADRARLVQENKWGMVAWEIGDDGAWHPRLIALAAGTSQTLDRPRLDLNREPEGVTMITPSVAVSAPARAITTPLELVRAAEAINGGASKQIPGWRELGITSDDWKRLISQLKARGLVEATPGKGTFVRQYDSLYDLHAALEHGRIVLSGPLPHPAAGD